MTNSSLLFIHSELFCFLLPNNVYKCGVLHGSIFITLCSRRILPTTLFICRSSCIFTKAFGVIHSICIQWIETTCLETFDECFRFCSKIDDFSQEGCKCHFIQNFTWVFCMPVSPSFPLIHSDWTKHSHIRRLQ